MNFVICGRMRSALPGTDLGHWASRLDKATRHLLDKWLRVDAARKDRSEDGGEPRERTSKRGVAEFDIKLGGSEGSRGVRDERREDRTEDEPRGETRVARKEEEALSLLDKVRCGLCARPRARCVSTTLRMLHARSSLNAHRARGAAVALCGFRISGR